MLLTAPLVELLVFFTLDGDAVGIGVDVGCVEGFEALDPQAINSNMRITVNAIMNAFFIADSPLYSLIVSITTLLENRFSIIIHIILMKALIFNAHSFLC